VCHIISSYCFFYINNLLGGFVPLHDDFQGAACHEVIAFVDGITSSSTPLTLEAGEFLPSLLDGGFDAAKLCNGGVLQIADLLHLILFLHVLTVAETVVTIDYPDSFGKEISVKETSYGFVLAVDLPVSGFAYVGFGELVRLVTAFVVLDVKFGVLHFSNFLSDFWNPQSLTPNI